MKTDLRSFNAIKKELKKEFSKLTDLDYLKKEFNRVASEVTKLDLHLQPHLSPQLTSAARQKLEQLDRRFRELMHAIQELQKQVDGNLDKFIAKVREKRSQKTTRRSAGIRSTNRSAAARAMPRETAPAFEAAATPVATTKKRKASSKAGASSATIRVSKTKSEKTKSTKPRKTRGKSS